MAFPSVTYTLVNGATSDAGQVNQNFSDILNGLSDTTKDISVNNITGASGGTLTAGGNVVLGTSTSQTITINGKLSSSIPVGTNTTYDFGSATLGLRSVYVGGTSTFTTRIMSAATASWTMTLPATAGTANQVPVTDGSGNLSFVTLQGNATVFKAPTVQQVTSTGTQSGLAITCTSANATVGATYTNNGHTYTVLQTIAAGTLLFVSGTGATSGTTLTKSGGTGDATITFSATQTLATYAVPSGPAPIYLKVKISGAGGGGGGNGAGAGSGGSGKSSYFLSDGITGNALLGNMGGGSGGGSGVSGGDTIPAGGTSSVTNSAAIVASFVGGQGQGNSGSGTAGGQGGTNPFGGAGGGASFNSGAGNTGGTAVANSGAGGGGSGPVASTTNNGCGGGSGGYAEFIVTNLLGGFYVSIGTGGTFGAGTSIGGVGAAGVVIVEEFYQ